MPAETLQAGCLPVQPMPAEALPARTLPVVFLPYEPALLLELRRMPLPPKLRL